jgi:hypothetical protein
MTNRAFGITLFALAACAAGFGQTSYQGPTPGRSTRGEVKSASWAGLSEA